MKDYDEVREKQLEAKKQQIEKELERKRKQKETEEKLKGQQAGSGAYLDRDLENDD